ncbi:tRNA pseudouridine(55) synthase TruB [Limosilactobacillus sp. STM2_1]|uniref:tRNA pseudouridine synthase B n=1 Tax=Limosilactobacillus rudii TaxID=2759755 RepID=A0A7W3UKG0_9LACO|nr:tRNA pseudouridine(55) synthase TruB [Limosilactobacillus rudii]MBB1078633.1 tRNA pseudouridine(55) synthase TruB [Limosilactobacillus rudii]MBB1097273.1 tRNA pseudouridine(55) synthase TruB [Limosilactobacillus rudii]MCD7133811.1 tRNA pseudouridine(55) synthase TruB [Limosilactobacillus rudii]
MDGIIPLYKERGMTSFACVSRLRQILKTRKIGHSGTLDPNVAGVLPICVGNATKVVDYLMQSGKQYQGELLVGFSTTTQDLDGEKIAEKPVEDEIPLEKIKATMEKLTGIITQIPPMYSAVKVNGKKLYEYARAGETVKRPKRQVEIKKFVLLSSKYDGKNKQQRIRFNVECSKGTYIRTLVVELARQLGYPGVMSILTRLKSGGFTLEQTLSLTDIQDAVATQTLQQYMYPLDYALRGYPRIDLQTPQWKKVQNGGWLSPSELNTSKSEIVLLFDGQVKALYHFDAKNKLYKPTKMFAVK